MTDTTHDQVTLDGRAGLRWLRSRLRLKPGRTMVAIDGLLGSGKTSFADELAGLIGECGINTVRISLVDYLNPQDVRYAQGRTSPKGFFEDSFDLDLFMAEVIEPLGQEGSGRYRAAAYDRDRETPVRSPWRVAPESAVIIIDGTLLHCPRFAVDRSHKLWDLSVWLEVPFVEAYRRLHETLGVNQDPQDASNARYYEGQLIYLRECDPSAKADLIIDNSTRHAPVD